MGVVVGVGIVVVVVTMEEGEEEEEGIVQLREEVVMGRGVILVVVHVVVTVVVVEEKREVLGMVDGVVEKQKIERRAIVREKERRDSYACTKYVCVATRMCTITKEFFFFNNFVHLFYRFFRVF